jgi:hypothetical protein
MEIDFIFVLGWDFVIIFIKDELANGVKIFDQIKNISIAFSHLL